MTKDKETPAKNTPAKAEVGLVTLTGDIGIGIRMPDDTVIDMQNTNVGTAQVLAYLVKNVSEIRKNI